MDDQSDESDNHIQVVYLSILCFMIPFVQTCILLIVKDGYPKIREGNQETVQTLEYTRANYRELYEHCFAFFPDRDHVALRDWLSIKEINANKYSDNDKKSCLRSEFDKEETTLEFDDWYARNIESYRRPRDGMNVLMLPFNPNVEEGGNDNDAAEGGNDNDAAEGANDNDAAEGSNDNDHTETTPLINITSDRDVENQVGGTANNDPPQNDNDAESIWKCLCKCGRKHIESFLCCPCRYIFGFVITICCCPFTCLKWYFRTFCCFNDADAPGEEHYKTPMMATINYQVKIYSIVSGIKQWNIGLKVSEATQLKGESLSWIGVVQTLRKINRRKPELPNVLTYSVVRALKTQEWDYATKGTRLDPQTLCEKPWPQIKDGAFAYIDSFLLDVWFYWGKVWMLLVVVKLVVK
jgi:hypothetical protein